MHKSLSYKILSSILALGTFTCVLPANAAYVDGKYINDRLTNINYDNALIYENYNTKYAIQNEDSNKKYVIVKNSTVSEIDGLHVPYIISEDPYPVGHTVYITDSTVNDDIYGVKVIRDGRQYPPSSNIVIIENSTVKSGSNIIGSATINTKSNNNTIELIGNTVVEGVNLYGWDTSPDPLWGYGGSNTLVLNDWSGKVGSIHRFDNINFENIDITKGSTLTATGTVSEFGGTVNINSITIDPDNLAGDYTVSWLTDELSTISAITLDDKINVQNVNINQNVTDTLNNFKFEDKYYISNNDTNGIFVNKFEEGSSINVDTDDKNNIKFNAYVNDSILTGKFIDVDGTESANSNGNTDLNIDINFTTNVATVAGVYAAGNQAATGGVVNVNAPTEWNGTIYAAYSEGGSESGTINVYSATGVWGRNITLSGGSNNETGSTLNIFGDNNHFKSFENFETINFKDIETNQNRAALTVESGDITDTTINLESLAGGQTFKEGDTLTLIEGNISGKAASINNKVTAGLTQDLTIEEIYNEATEGDSENEGESGSLQIAIKDVAVNGQIDLLAQNRAASAAFINQGTDLISDSLDTLSRDDNYGVKTFAAVHGNRSKYDVNSDLKINGWSTIVGVGNAAEFADGDEFSWGVFYENGSGNYRTYNEFNNEFFRGDGSLVYNGGGIAARYENANGVYTEGSLRAGMLKSDMDNALRDGSGNYYGYDSESAYYGAHIGVGKIISLNESSDLDVYGKFFHTYTEGDSFTVANDKFEFDSITSDRLRLGARVTTNKKNAFSTYYGLAYEYEFNGDADMRAQNLAAPTQSLQGSSYMAELGFNYQPTPDSPWSFDLNLRGYAGEREGGSFNVQATYTF